MATNLTYQKPLDLHRVFSLKDARADPYEEVPIANLINTPEDVLKKLISEYHVVRYLGVQIPSKAIGDNINEGLKISEAEGYQDKAISLEDCLSNPLFDKAKHKPLTLEDKQKLGKNIFYLMNINMHFRHRGDKNSCQEEAQKYLTILQNLDYKLPMSAIIEYRLSPFGIFNKIISSKQMQGIQNAIYKNEKMWAERRNKWAEQDSIRRAKTLEKSDHIYMC